MGNEVAYIVHNYRLIFDNLLHIPNGIRCKSKMVLSRHLVELDHDRIALANGNW